MNSEIQPRYKFGIVNAILFVVFCCAIGEVLAMLLVGVIYDGGSLRISEMMEEQPEANRSLLVSLIFFSTLFRFVIVPGFYLLFTSRDSFDFFCTSSKICFTPALLAVLLVFVLTPLTSVLIDFNYRLELPVWLSDLEVYIKYSEERAQRLMSHLLTFTEPNELLISILVLAIIPGIAEEFFFRGVVQSQFQGILRNPHYAILLSAALFSFSHLQFYGFIPRMALGMLLGYVFYWSKNIWYPTMMHIANNIIGILGVYFVGPEIMNPESGSTITMFFVLSSTVVSVLLVLYLRRTLAVPGGKV